MSYNSTATISCPKFNESEEVHFTTRYYVVLQFKSHLIAIVLKSFMTEAVFI